MIESRQIIVGLVISAMLTWVGKGLFQRLGGELADEVTAWLVRLVVSSRSKLSPSDEELAEKTDELCEGVVRELYNRGLSQPELDSELPRESALSQQEYDAETVEKLKRKTGERSVVPSFEVLREEYQHRGLWRSECDEL